MTYFTVVRSMAEGESISMHTAGDSTRLYVVVFHTFKTACHCLLEKEFNGTTRQSSPLPFLSIYNAHSYACTVQCTVALSFMTSTRDLRYVTRVRDITHTSRLTTSSRTFDATHNVCISIVNMAFGLLLWTTLLTTSTRRIVLWNSGV